MRIVVLCLFCAVCFLSGCFKKENDCAPKNISASSDEIRAVSEYLNSQSITATKHDRGLFYKVIQEGYGNSPSICSDVRVKFSGRLASGAEFEHNDDVILNVKLTMEAWRIMLPMMKPGSKVMLYVPPSLGYGNEGKTDKPTGAVLVAPNTPVIIYEITLIEVK